MRSHGANHHSTLLGIVSSARKWPAEMGSPPPLYFNAGMFVFEPSRFTYESLIEALQITPTGPFADQVSYMY